MIATDDRPPINILGGIGRLCGHCGKEVPETDTFESHLLVTHGLRKCAVDDCHYTTEWKFCLDHITCGGARSADVRPCR
jgi:hypothetical protein